MTRAPIGPKRSASLWAAGASLGHASLALTLALGCASPPPARAPGYEPPPARARALTRDEVWAEVQASPGAEQAIARLDLFPFAFELGPELPWFEAQGLPATVLDYLRKRSRIDWASLRGDVDPDGGDLDEGTR